MTQYLKEEFKTLVDEDGLVERYKISNYGRIFDTQSNCFISQVLTGKPQYFYVNYNTPEKRKLRRVHNLMARAFLADSYYDGASVDHTDINPYNNSLDNLRWATRKQQARNQKTNRYLINNGKKQLIKEYIEENNLTANVYQWFMTRAIESSYNPETIIKEYEDYLISLYPPTLNYYGFNLSYEDYSSVTGVSLDLLLRARKYKYSDTETKLGQRVNINNYEEVSKDSVVNICCHNQDPYLKLDSVQSLYKELSGCYHDQAKNYKYEVLIFNEMIVVTNKDGDLFITDQQGLCDDIGITVGELKWNLSKGYTYQDIFDRRTIVNRKTFYTINGVKKRRAYWCEDFGVNAKALNNYMARTKVTFKEALEKYGVDTSCLNIS